MGKRLRASVTFLALFIFAFLSAAPAPAQTPTAVSGTIKDANGLPYSNAKVFAQLVGIPPNVNATILVNGIPTAIGGQFNSSTDVNGTFSLSLFCNTAGGGCSVISPSGTQWQFVVDTTGAPPPLGTGPQTCTATVTITGTSQSITSNFSCPALSNTGGGSGAGGSPVLSGLIGQYALTDAGSPYLDSSGSGNNLANGACGANPSPNGAANGGGVVYSATNQCLDFPAALNGALTFMVFMKHTDAGYTPPSLFNNYRTIIGNSNGYVVANSMQWLLYQSPTTSDTWGNESQGIYRFRSSNASSASFRSSSTCAPNGTFIASFVMGASDTYYIGTTACSLYQNSAPTAGFNSGGNLRLGATAGISQGTGTIATFYYILVYNRALAANEIAQNIQFLTNTMAARGITVSNDTTDTGSLCIADGDSLTAGVNWPLPLLNIPCKVADQGFPGQTAATISNNAPLDADLAYRPAGGYNVITNWSGTNAPSPASTVIANHSQFCAQRRLKGWNKCITTTMIDRTGNLLSHDVLNDAIRTQEPAFVDLICDQAANVHLGADGANTNPTYFTDGVHLTTFSDQNIVGPNFIHCINYASSGAGNGGKYSVYKGTGSAVPQSTSNQVNCNSLSGTTTSCTLPFNAAAGSLLFVNIVCQTCSGITITSVTDGGDTFSGIGSLTTISGNAKMQAFNAPNVTSGAKTVTVNWAGGTASNVFMSVIEYSGVATVTPVDVSSAIATGTSTTPTGTAVTTTAPNELLIGYGGFSSTNGGGFITSQSDMLQRLVTYNSPTEDKLTGAAGSYNAAFTTALSGTWGVGVVAFKVGPAGTSTYNVQDFDVYAECDPSGGNTGLNLPDASWMTGYTITIKNIQSAGANTCTVNGITPLTTGVAQQIDGAASVTVANKATLVVRSKLTFTGTQGTNYSPVSNWQQLQNN